MTTIIRITAEQMEQLAFLGGYTIELRPDRALLRTGHRVFEAPLPLPEIPEQRQPGSDE